MKKKMGLWIVLGIVVVLVIAGAVWGKGYYESRYVGTDYYAAIPVSFDATPEMQYGDYGNEMGLGKEYVLTAYNEQGEAKAVTFAVFTENDALPQPGEYLRISASEQVVTGWNVIDKSDVPSAALTKIEASA
jgi:uncharacterized protein (TIGR01655 family)